MPLEFLANATKAAKEELLNRVSNTCTVHCTANYTVFYRKSEYVVANGNLHDKVDAPFCIEFDLVYNYGSVVVKGQRLFN